MIFTVYMLLCGAFGIIFSSRIANSKKARISYCVFGGMGLFFISALRSTAVGYDSGRYAYLFRHINEMSWSRIWSEDETEPLFFSMMKVLQVISSHENLMFAVIAACFAVSITVFIYKYSEFPYISFIMLIPMQFFPFTLSGCRQAIAMSISVISFTLIVKHKYLKSLIFFAVAYLFHNSVLIAVPLILIYLIKNKIIARILFISGLIISSLFRVPLLEFIITYIYTDYDILDKPESATTTLIMYLAIYIISVIFINNPHFQKRTDSTVLREEYAMIRNTDGVSTEKSVYLFLEMMLAVGIIIQTFVPLQPNIFRAAMYYQIASIIIIPKAISNITDKLLRIFAIMAFIIVMAILYYVFTYYSAGVNPYYFFWQK